MQWIKKGLIFRTEGQHDWMVSHASVPTVIRMTANTIRVYFAPRDTQGRSHITFVDVAADNPSHIRHVHDQPVMSLGELGTFDDSGTMPSCIVRYQETLYLYYIGWNQGRSVPYRNALGVAVSEDNGLVFTRLFKGPVVDRSPSEPHFCASCHICIENGIWRMWYTNCTKWEIVEGRAEPFYHIKYAESTDGIVWKRDGTVAIDYNSPDEAGITRPFVVHEDNIYKMWYSHRKCQGYRTNRAQSYRIGYAESNDGICWKRLDDEVGIDVSDSGWDSEMIEYPNIYKHERTRFMIYNGNGFGQSGFGYAVSAEEHPC